MQRCREASIQRLPIAVIPVQRFLLEGAGYHRARTLDLGMQSQRLGVPIERLSLVPMLERTASAKGRGLAQRVLDTASAFPLLCSDPAFLSSLFCFSFQP